MQTAVIEYARNVLGFKDANSGEFDKQSGHKVIDLMPDQKGVVDMGGTMRLGAYPCKIRKNTIMDRAYGVGEIKERHRHRYEVNIKYKSQLAQGGMMITATSPDGKLPEIVERPDHPWFIGVQFHPELKSKPFAPHPLFVAFVEASIKQSRLV